MKKLIQLIAACFCSVSIVSAQSYNGPESIEFDPADGKYFVGNANDGTMVKLSPDGTLSTFAASVSFPTGPHGLELIADTLYACDGANLKMINRTTGGLIANIAMGATFLNGITHKDNNLYITDFSAKKIHRFNVLTRQHNIFCSTINSKTPNGIIYDDINDRLVYCCWGTNAPVHAISLADSTVTSIATTTLGNCDGITMNCSGDFYIASWSQNRATKFNHAFTTNSIFLPGLSSPADIYYNRLQDSLYVPNSGNNTVAKAGDVSCTVSLKGRDAIASFVQCYPNPAKDELRFKAEELSSNAQCKIFDLQGKLLMDVVISSSHSSVNIATLEKGIYFMSLQMLGKQTIVKFIKE